jgi:protein associated with RNAse G/E
MTEKTLIKNIEDSTGKLDLDLKVISKQFDSSVNKIENKLNDNQIQYIDKIEKIISLNEIELSNITSNFQLKTRNFIVMISQKVNLILLYNLFSL